MISEKDIIDDLLILSEKLSLMVSERRNNSEFWANHRDKINEMISDITKDKRIYGW